MKLKVEQDPDQPVPKPVLAKSIVDISAGFKKLLASGLNERAVVVLVHDACGVGKPDIRAVLKSLTFLSSDFCK